MTNYQRLSFTSVCVLAILIYSACGVEIKVASNGNENRDETQIEKPSNAQISAQQKSQTPTPQPALTTNAKVNNNAITNSSVNNRTVTSTSLIIPVIGIKPNDLRDTFNDARSENRVHDAIDIMAQHNAVVIATADGEIAKFFDSERGGITIYQFSADKKMIYYYAHLDRRAENIKEGDFIKQGTTIGYVGDTGNAGAGNYHLHFAIWTIQDPKHFYDGANINPYPLLK